MDGNITSLRGCETSASKPSILSILGQSMWVASGVISTYHALLTFWRDKTPFNTGVLASSVGSALYSGSLLIGALADVEPDHRHYMLPLTTTGCTIAVICHQYYLNQKAEPNHIKSN